MRASREPFDLSTGGISTPISFSRKAGVPSACSAYMGWKQPPVDAARATTANTWKAIRVLTHDIHDPLGNHDHPADSLSAQRRFYRIKCQNGSLNFRVWRAACHGHLPALLAIDLNHHRDCVLN